MPNLQKGDLKGMRSLAIIFNYIKKYPKLVFGYFSLNLLSALFSLVSLTMLAPFLTLIFELESKGVSLSSRFSFGVLSEKLYTHLGTLNGSTEGKIEALAILCIIIISAIVLKNIFLYGALYVLTPIRNGIINDMRNEIMR